MIYLYNCLNLSIFKVFLVFVTCIPSSQISHLALIFKTFFQMYSCSHDLGKQISHSGKNFFHGKSRQLLQQNTNTVLIIIFYFQENLENHKEVDEHGNKTCKLPCLTCGDNPLLVCIFLNKDIHDIKRTENQFLLKFFFRYLILEKLMLTI